MALFDDGTFKGHSLTNRGARLSKIEEVDQAVVRPTHEVIRALSKRVVNKIIRGTPDIQRHGGRDRVSR